MKEILRTDCAQISTDFPVKRYDDVTYKKALNTNITTKRKEE